jgi:uncharacterized membrane protein (GlpM family)
MQLVLVFVLNGAFKTLLVANNGKVKQSITSVIQLFTCFTLIAFFVHFLGHTPYFIV